MLTAVAGDGIQIRATEMGSGPIVLILPPGMDDGTGYLKTAEALATGHRVLILQRRQYRLDLRGGWSFADEVEDVLRIVETSGERVLLFGHSSGGYLALQTALARPDLFTAVAVYEPPVPLDRRPDDGFLRAAQRAIADGRPGKAMQIFTRDIVGLHPWQARLIRAAVSVLPKWRRLVPRQIDDVAAMHALGTTLDSFKDLQPPLLLIGGDRSPAGLTRRLDALERVVPRTARVVLAGQGHSAQMRAPRRLALVIADFDERSRTQVTD